MSKISKNKLDSVVYARIDDNFVAVLAHMTERRDMEHFLDSLLTRTERLMFAKRLAIAVLLERGRSYAQISKALKVSSVTIGFVRNSIMKDNKPYAQLIQQLSRSTLFET